MTIDYADRPFALPVTRHVVVEMPGNPIAKGRPRFWNGRAVTPPRTRNYEIDLAWNAKIAMQGHAPIEGPLKVEVLAAFSVPISWTPAKRKDALIGLIRPTGKPDLDNVLKILDALNGIVWRDDAQIVTAAIMKRYSDRPRLRIEVEALIGEGEDAWQPIGAAAKRVVEKVKP